jgi:hypothetical protein
VSSSYSKEGKGVGDLLFGSFLDWSAGSGPNGCCSFAHG